MKTDAGKKLLKALSLRVKLLRVGRGWSQETLAELAQLHRNYIGHLERSEVNIGLENLQQLSGAFDMSIGELLTFAKGGALDMDLTGQRWPDECSEDSASCDCSWHENMRAAEATHGGAS